MIELSRTLRFCLNDAPVSPADASPKANTFSTWPAPRGLARYYELDIACHGEADPDTGYFINIKHIDTAARQYVLPFLQQAVSTSTGSDVAMGSLLQGMLERLQPALNHSVHQITLCLTPFCRLSIERHHVNQIIIEQSYEFSAAHRLHVPGRSDEENYAIFGKCNNPAGHGHNYRVRVKVRAPINTDGRCLGFDELDQTVDTQCIQKLDHKHLNHDVPEFTGRNPSVEHIAQVVWSMLESPIADLEADAALDEVTVWETSKTACTYRGPSNSATSGAE